MTGSDPLGGGEFPFGDLSKLFGAFGNADPWQQAAQIAQAVASEGESEPNVEPKVRIALEDLARVALLYLAEVPGVASSPALHSTSVGVKPVTRAQWTTDSLDAYRQFFERFGEAIGQVGPPDLASGADPFAAMFGTMFSSLAPMMVAASAGAMIGHLGQHALGQYELPVPRSSDRVLVVPSAIDDAADEWGVPVDELRMWILVHELASHALITIPHVRRHFDALFIDFATAFRLDPARIEQEFGHIGGLEDLSKIQELSEQFNDPEAILSLMRTRTHDLLMPQLDALVAAFLGMVDFAVERVCLTLVPNHALIRQAMRERTLAVNPADRFMERLLGINITEGTLDRGRRFINGIIERVGDAGIEKLWGDELDMPTAAELDAPGLWLARVGLDPDMELPDIEIPDDLSGLDDL
ncbi:MAG: zinc-dependent metalloprotease [Acidimicrobiales bacterium]